jgi:hypothetical protein
MSAWLQQCGEGDASRQAFSFVWVMHDDGSVTVSGDAVESAGAAMVDRAMDPGWWEVTASFSLGSHVGREGAVAWAPESEFDYGAETWDSSIFSSTPWMLYYIFSTSTPKTQTDNLYIYENPCGRIGWVCTGAPGTGLPPPAGTTYEIVVTAARLAGPNCGDPS